MVYLGRFDACVEVSIMLFCIYHSHRALLYLKNFHGTEMVLDSNDLIAKKRKIERQDQASSDFAHFLDDKK